MTTTVIVKANHGWPVRVEAKNPKTGEITQTSTVEKDTERSFVVHSSQDLTVHEVQPDEIAKD